MWGFVAGTCECNLVLFKTCQSVEGSISNCSLVATASCFTEGNNSILHGVVFELLLTYSLQKEFHVKHYVAKQSSNRHNFKLAPHTSRWTAVKNYFPSTGFKF